MLVMHVAGGWDYVAVFNHSFFLSLSWCFGYDVPAKKRGKGGVSSFSIKLYPSEGGKKY